MRQLIYAVVTLVLLAVVGGSGWLWWRSYRLTDQFTLRLDPAHAWARYRGTDTPDQADTDPDDPLREGIGVWTSDRGRLGLLWLEASPVIDDVDGERAAGERGWVHESAVWAWRVASAAAPDAALLDALCAERGLGFGFDREVEVSVVERPAVAALRERSDAVGGGGALGAWRRAVVPWWSVTAAAGGMWLVWTLTFGVRVLRMSRGRCVRCGHDVSESSHYCPSCRKPIPRRTWSGDTRPRRAGRVEQVVGGGLERR